MIRNFANKAAADLFHKGQTKSLPQKHWQRACDLLDIMEAVEFLDDLKVKGFPPNLRLHKLKGSRKDEYAIDIHKIEGWRITFKFQANEFVEVKIENYH
ncbi:MAG: type II toxin-antitoxin system RelE/ParE family toxin [Oligoflexales bacterium]|nr:type II toxin-antitoxin system RelE/ParE family toxin [Oligoflexales bacterium]